jgi:hypothetical protein
MRAYLHFKPKTLQIGELKDACEKAISVVLGPGFTLEVGHPRTPSPGVSDTVWLGAESLRPLVDLSTIDISLTAKAGDKSYREISLSFQRADERESFIIWAGNEAAFQCLQIIVASLGLEQTEPPKDKFASYVEAIEARVASLAKSAKAAGNKPKCFISFKFDNPETVTQVNRLKRLLAAAHIEFLTGEEYEPRRIEDKVKGRLRADVDFLIAVSTKAGESKWIRDEIADANSRGLWIVLLLEEGATFEKGIFGSLEYVPFSLAIEQTFPAVLEGVNFIKADTSARQTRTN